MIIDPVKTDRLPMALIMLRPAVTATHVGTLPGSVQWISIRLNTRDAETQRQHRVVDEVGAEDQADADDRRNRSMQTTLAGRKLRED